MLADLINRPCSIIVRGQGTEVDDDGNEISVTSRVQTVCEAQPRSAVEPQGGGDLSSEEWTGFFLAADEEYLASDAAIGIPGLGVFEIEGRPAPWRNPRLQRPMFVQANLRRTAGPDEVPGS